MLQKIGSRRVVHLIAFLALFNFLIGVHSLHPHVHGHSDAEDSHHGGNQQQYYAHDHPEESATLAATHAATEDQSCPVCSFLAISSLLQRGAAPLSVPLLCSDKASTGEELLREHLQLKGFHVRGPPHVTFC